MAADRANNARLNAYGQPVAGASQEIPRLHVIGDLDFEPADAASCTCECHEDASFLELVRAALRARVRAFGEVELRQRELHEWIVLLVAFAIAAMLVVPAMVPLVLALQGERP